MGSDDPAVEKAARLAARLIEESSTAQTPRERRQSSRMARLLAGGAGRSAVLALTDEVLRINDSRRAASVYSRLARSGGNLLDDWRSARYLAGADRVAFVLGARLAPLLPGLVVPLVRRRVASEMSGVVLPSGARRLDRHARNRGSAGTKLNINVLGEAVLGEDEAERRLRQVLDVLGRPSVDYVSVKISSVCSQLDVLAHEAEIERIAAKLRRIYRAADRHQPAKFVNLDMEEYRDLELTTAVFRRVLDEEEFRRTSAGIVLQAYLPDSAEAMDGLCRWALDRRRSGGGWVKVRIVKGANLAVEQVDAELHGWEPAPFPTKEETDANYKRMLAMALDPALDGALRIGVASHNPFELAWASQQAGERGGSHRLELEMLEGMSPALARVVARRLGGLLLYAPIVDPAEMHAAIAYLVRRLDENTGEDNFIAHQFALSVGSRRWAAEVERFSRSVAASRCGSPARRRRQDREAARPTAADYGGGGQEFRNEPDTDFTRPANRRWAAAHLGRVRDRLLPVYRPVICGVRSAEEPEESGVDPARPGAGPPYRWAPASIDAVESAVAVARTAGERWRGTPPIERAAVLRGAAAALAGARGAMLAVMALDAGKTVREADTEVSEAVDFASYYSRRIPSRDGGFEPYGTVVVVPPWNFPLSIPAGGVLGALAAGNTVILKPAPETVAVAGEMVQVLWRGGVPREALHFVPCTDGEASRRLVTHPDVDAVVLTGSWDTARMFLDWRPDMNLHAETSGKNAIVVSATADPDSAITDIVHSAFGHAGQKCSAASLAILEASVFDDGRFLRRLADAVRTLRVGDPADPATVMGPLIRPPSGPLAAALTRLGDGERWLVAPERMDEAGHLWSPGVKLGVQPGSSFHLTECFGPVLGIMRAADLDQALEWQNQPPYGLTAGLQALDPLEIDAWRARVEAGNLYVNRGITGAVVGRQPFGGWRRSVLGPGAKSGGPNYVAGMGRWPAATGSEAPEVLAAAYRSAWRAVARPADPTGLTAEANVFRYRPLERVALCGGSREDLDRALAAAKAVGVCAVAVTAPREAEGGRYDKLRVLGAADSATLSAAHATGLWVDALPVLADERREVLRWAREQSVSESRHRHGDVTSRRPGLLPPRDVGK